MAGTTVIGRCWRVLAFGLLLSASVHATLQPISSLMLPASVMPAEAPGPLAERTLQVGILQDNTAPRNIVVGNDLYGINADYLVALHQSAGLNFSIHPYASAESLMKALDSGALDVAFGLSRSKLPVGYAATQPWYSSPLRIYRNRNNARPVMFNSGDARIAISRDSYRQLTPTFAQQHQWQVRDSDLQALYTLLNQQSDYVVADETSAGFLLNQLQQGQIYQLESPLEPGQLNLQAIGRDPRVIAALDEALKCLPVEVVNGIQARWSSQLPRYQDTNTALLTPMERSWIATHPTVTYAAVSDDYPWSYRQANGQPAGYSIDLLAMIGQNTGLHFQPRWVSNPQEASALVNDGQAALQLTRPLTGDDNMQGNALPIWRSLWGVYVGNASHNVSRWQNSTGLRVGIRRGDIARQMIPAGAQVIAFDNRKMLYDALANGQLDALVDNVFSARWQLESTYGDAIHLAFAASDTAWPIAFGIARSEPLLRTLLNKSLQQIPAETQQRLRESWSNNSSIVREGTSDSMRPVSLFFFIAALFAIAFLLVLLVRRYLEQRRERLQRLQIEQEREDARRANAMKSQFLATVSHELRTPMQAILGLLEVEVARQPEQNNLAVIQRSASGLMTLLNDLQDHARVENNTFTLTPRPFDLAHWLDYLAAFYQPLMPESGPQLIVEAITPLPPRVMLDGARLQQVANNLIGNALKFTREGTIQVTLSAQDQQLQLQVSDSGIGIPPAEQARLFEPWYQPPSGRLVSVQGSGLGLSICREIITRMGGEITLTSQPDSGTTVCVTLPLQLASAESVNVVSLAETLAASSALRVAVVDDHPTNLLVMTQQLAQCNIQAATFADGRAFLRAASQQPFDLVLVDASMPHPDGVTVVRVLRRIERDQAHHTRLVLCSADARILEQQQSDGLLDGWLVKPIALNDIQRLLQPTATLTFDDLPQRLTQLAHHDASYQQRLRDTLLSSLRDDSQRLAQAAAARQWQQIAASAHRMKGSWLLLGYSEGETLCQRLIQAAGLHQVDKSALNLLLSLGEKLSVKLENYGA